MRAKINEIRQIRNYVARMRGPQPVKLALDLIRTKYQKTLFELGQSDSHMMRPHERFSRQR